MMQANQLRIGNLVTSKTWKGAHRVTGVEITDSGFTVKVGDYDYPCEEGKYFDISGIPLTEDLLVKAGLDRTTHFGFEHQQAEYYIEQQDDWFFIGINHGNSTNYFVWHIKYVHQLQNIYFILTGQELQFN